LKTHFVSLFVVPEIEILKTEAYTDYLGKKLRVWFRIDAKLSSCNCQNNNAALTSGLIVMSKIDAPVINWTSQELLYD
jgi:hypothetical protein